MASTIRIRAVQSDGVVDVKALVQHPMDSGFLKDPGGKIIPAHFIETLTFEHAGKPVFIADYGRAVSKNPYIEFKFKGGKKGDDIKAKWVDNEGKKDEATYKII